MSKSFLVVILMIALMVLASIAIFLFYTGLKIEGKAIDSITKKPVAAAIVKINDKVYQTNQSGAFKAYLPIFPSATILAEKNGYKHYSKLLETQWQIGTKKIELVLEPVTFENILEKAKNDLLSYDSYSFRYIWYSRMGEPDETHTYMLYQVAKGSTFRFKYLQDDRLGQLITSREIVRSGQTIFFKDTDSPQWIRIREEDISITKLQDPFDILLIFHEEEPPGLFVFEEELDLYSHSSGLLYTKDELEQSISDTDLSSYQIINTKTYTARWINNDHNKYILFFLDDDFRLLRADLIEEAPDDTGKIIKQSLNFYISFINQDIHIEIPKVD